MKIILTGAAGMLAAEVIPQLIKEGHSVVQTDINRRLPQIESLNITSLDETLRKVDSVRPDYIFHFAAETDVDLCEEDPDHAFRVNTIGTENIALACKEFSSSLLYISTGNVFKGDKSSPYTEFDKPDPVSFYGQSKLQAELIVKDLLSNYFIIRAGWMVGGWELDKKFVYKIIQQVKQKKRELKVVSDRFGSPTFTKDFAVNLMPIINSRRYGLYHMANQGTCSRYDMAVKIIEFMGCEDRVTIYPVNSAQFPLPASRPRSEMLSNYKLDLLGFNHMPCWESSLEEYIKMNKDK